MSRERMAAALRSEELREDFRAVFNQSDDTTQRVMNVLGQLFGYVNQSLYDRDAADPSGEALVRSGHQEVLQFIGAMIAEGKDPHDDQSS